jgi:hypothetical protein
LDIDRYSWRDFGLTRQYRTHKNQAHRQFETETGGDTMIDHSLYVAKQWERDEYAHRINSNGWKYPTAPRRAPAVRKAIAAALVSVARWLDPAAHAPSGRDPVLSQLRNG